MTFNAITPTNLGETIKRDALDQKKWDVKFDENQFEFTVDGIHLKDKVTEPLENVDILDASLEGTTLKLEQVNGHFIEIPMEGIIPEPSKDIHLKAVNYNTQNKTLTFVTGETANETSDKSFTIDVSDMIPVTASNGVQGNGTSTSPLSVKLGKDSKLHVDTAGVDFAMLSTWELVDSTGNNLLGAIMPGSKIPNTAVEEPHRFTIVGGGFEISPSFRPVGTHNIRGVQMAVVHFETKIRDGFIDLVRTNVINGFENTEYRDVVERAIKSVPNPLYLTIETGINKESPVYKNVIKIENGEVSFEFGFRPNKISSGVEITPSDVKKALIYNRTPDSAISISLSFIKRFFQDRYKQEGHSTWYGVLDAHYDGLENRKVESLIDLPSVGFVTLITLNPSLRNSASYKAIIDSVKSIDDLPNQPIDGTGGESSGLWKNETRGLIYEVKSSRRDSDDVITIRPWNWHEPYSLKGATATVNGHTYTAVDNTGFHIPVGDLNFSSAINDVQVASRDGEYISRTYIHITR